jgi:hypothetical protein
MTSTQKMQVETLDILKWPEGWERTRIDARKPQGAWKKTTLQAREALLKELERNKATSVLISLNAADPLRDPAVAVYFSRHLSEDYSWQDALEIDNPAPTLDEIDAAFRKKAMTCHPDRFPDDPEKLKQFEAYQKHRKNAKAWVLGTHTSEHEFVIPCDKFKEQRMNMTAIRLALAAFRQLERVGVPSILERTFRGFRTALPAHASSVEKGKVNADTAT